MVVYRQPMKEQQVPYSWNTGFQQHAPFAIVTYLMMLHVSTSLRAAQSVKTSGVSCYATWIKVWLAQGEEQLKLGSPPSQDGGRMLQ
jgi:hypothetical protein